LAAPDQGLYKYDKNSDNFSFVINPATGKTLEPVASIIEDDNRNLWMESPSGLIKFNKQQNTFTVYGSGAGVNVYNLNGSAAYKDSRGQLYFNDKSGYYSFLPGNIVGRDKPPEILLTDFRISNLSVQSGNNNSIDNPIWKTNEIKLRYDQNVLSFDFLVIDYADPAHNQSIYMLENYDNNWRPGGGNGRADYFNLPPGNYIFKIKALNGNGIQAEKSITIIINPPWWRTWWAYTIFALLCVGTIWGFINYRSRQLRKENRILEEKVARRTVELHQQKEALQATLENLKSTQAQLIQSEKMASLGELTAGIAHEIQNPLNFVNNFSEVNKEMVDEAAEEMNKENYDEVKNILNDIKDNEHKINHHDKRADSIVKGMLQHSRVSTGQKEPTDINALCDEYLRLCFQGLRAKDKNFNADIQTDFDESIGKINVIPQDIGRVLLNLYNNAFYAVSKPPSPRSEFGAGSKGEQYKPLVTVTTRKIKLPANDAAKRLPLGTGGLEIIVSDNGNGIPQNIVDKIFQPFFTTKPTGQGTGLGLSLSYDIIKAHGGEIKVSTNEGEGTTFTIQLPG
jgi:signal transduction histidine kinase